MSFVATEQEQKPLLEQLKRFATITTILDHNPDTSNPTWFPRRIRDLDIFATRVLV